MKHIEVDEELYQFIVTNTQEIGESASSILRRLLSLDNKTPAPVIEPDVAQVDEAPEQKIEDKPVLESIFNVINKEELAMQRGVVGRFLIILSALHRVHSQSFHKVCEIRGRDRLYFATSEDALEQSGSSTKPRLIPNSNFWVMTNSNTTRKKMMLTKAAAELGYSESDIEAIRDLL